MMLIAYDVALCRRTTVRDDPDELLSAAASFKLDPLRCAMEAVNRAGTIAVVNQQHYHDHPRHTDDEAELELKFKT